jgi:erythromycin esterase-like protein
MLKNISRIAFALLLAPSCTAIASTPATTDIGAIVDMLCSKRVVMLGEDSGHGAGATVAIKGRMVEALVDRCGFDALYFESPVYEFIDFEERLARGDTGPEHLADAVGPIWAGTQEFEPTLRWLWQRSQAGTLRLHGLDVQMGGISQRFSERELPARLAAHAGPERATCEVSLGRLTSWDFTASHPYDDAFRQRLRRCLSGIERALASSEDDPDRFSQRLAIGALRFLDMSDGDDFNVRDEAMAQNFLWHHTRAPGERAILWTSTRHAAKAPLPDHPDRISLGMHLQERFGDQLASIGFSAKTGQHGRQSRTPVSIANTTDALEHRAGDAHYLDAVRLRRMGDIASSVVTYGRPLRAEWSTVLDGIVLLPRETPLHVIEHDAPPSPQL